MITKKQLKLLRLFKLGYSVGMVAKRCKIQRSAVYKMVGRMEKNGTIKKGFHFKGTTSPVCRPLRLHGQQFQIKIIYSSGLYRKLLEKTNIMDFKNFKIRLFKESITLWILKDFTQSDTKKAYKESMIFLEKSISLIQSRLGVTLVKPGYPTIKEVGSHYAETSNELAEDLNKKKQKLSIKCPKDGKTFLKIDNSFQLNELETLHPENSQEDMENIRDQFIFMRENPQAFQNIVKSQEELTKLIKTQLEDNNSQRKYLNTILEEILKTYKHYKQPPPQDPKEPEKKDPADYIG